jgi:tRNA (guanine-N7-)-methyltransferase
VDEHRPLRTFGRIKARTLKPRQAGLMDTLLPHLALAEDGAIDLAVAFGDDVARLVFLEIGFGGGEHLVAQAAAAPEGRFIGVEPFINGVASCLRHIEESGVQNVRLHQGDARDVIAWLPDESVQLCYILFPDPWPKARHHKRRLIQPAFLDDLARVLRPGAEVRFATDWANYASWALEHFSRDARFAWMAERAEDWRNAWPGHVTTRYEAKKLGDCAPIWLRFQRA